MPPTNKALHKYLTRYAEPEAGLTKGFPSHYQRCLVVPFYRESTTALERFIQFINHQQDTLLIIVSNRPATDTETQWHQTLIHHIEAQPSWSSLNQQLILFPVENKSAVLIVDRVLYGDPIPAEQGVGLARKIGADIACQLIDDQYILSPWIANTDADVYLPDDYFAPQKHTLNAAALVYPYQHIFTDDCPRLPTLLYEFSLHHYVEGLRWAGSPYAYHTLGSIVAAHYHHYAQVRGFPKRSGAEDFYLLNKLAKTGSIISIDAPTINIQARHSNRVPFGTGPATSKLNQENNKLDMPLYHPASFVYLKTFLNLLQQWAENPQDYQWLLRTIISRQPNSVNFEQLQRCCEQLKLPQALTHCLTQGSNSSSRLQHLHTWFDSFRTLKLIHLLRNQSLNVIIFREWKIQSKYWQQSHSNRMLQLYAEIEVLTCTTRITRE